MADLQQLKSPSSDMIQGVHTGYDAATMTVSMDFTCPDAFRSPRGVCHGGFVPSFLDEVMGGAVYHASGNKLIPLNLDCNVSYLRLVPIGPLKAKGRVLKMGRNIAYIEGELFDLGGKLLARATSTAMLTEIPDGQA